MYSTLPPTYYTSRCIVSRWEGAVCTVTLSARPACGHGDVLRVVGYSVGLFRYAPCEALSEGTPKEQAESSQADSFLLAQWLRFSLLCTIRPGSRRGGDGKQMNPCTCGVPTGHLPAFSSRHRLGPDQGAPAGRQVNDAIHTTAPQHNTSTPSFFL